MAKRDRLNRKIKESFEHQQSAPDLWSGIASSLNESTPHGIDQKVRASFNEQNHEAPEKVWSGVNKQLTIDKGWNKVQKVLIRMTFFRKLKRAAVFLFLLFLFWTPLSNIQSLIQENFELNDKRELSFHSSNKNSGALKKNQESVPKSDEEVSKENKSSKDNNQNASKIKISENGKREGNINTKNREKDNTGVPNSPVSIYADKSKSGHSMITLPTLKLLKSKTFSLFEHSLQKDLLSFNATDQNNNEMLESKKHFEIGVIAAVNESILINNELRMAFDPQSLVAFRPELGSQFGAVLSYRFDTKFAIQGMLIHSHFQQAFEKFESGKLVTENSDFRFLRLQTLGQYNYQLKNPTISASLKLGPYFSYLYNYHVAIDDEPVDLSQNTFNRIDAGLTTHIGLEHQFEKDWVLDYGLNVSKGLLNLNNSTLKKPASFDPTRSFELGIYISVRKNF